MARRGRSTTIGKIAQVHLDRRRSEIRILGERLRSEKEGAPAQPNPLPQTDR